MYFLLKRLDVQGVFLFQKVRLVLLKKKNEFFKSNIKARKR